MATFTGNPGLNDNFAGASDVADQFFFAVTDLNNLDTVYGGQGAVTDQLFLTGSGTVTAANLTGVSHIEEILMGSGQTLYLANALLGTADATRLIVRGTAGNDVIDALAVTGSVAKSLDTTLGTGSDTYRGSGGLDVVRIESADLTSADTVSGGAGDDILFLINSGVISAADLSGVSSFERIWMPASGGVTLSLTTALLASADGARVVVLGGDGNDVVDGSAVAVVGAKYLDITAGGGVDNLTGGATGDYFRFSAGQLTAADTVVGGGGVDTLLMTGPGVITAANLAGLSGLERVWLSAGGANNISFNNAFLTNNAANFTVLGTAGNDTVDGSAATLAGSRLLITSGVGNDTLRGGAGNDVFNFAVGELTGADIVQGNGGTADILQFSNAGTIAAANLVGVSGVEQIRLGAGTNFLTLTSEVFTGITGPLIVLGNSGRDSIDGASLGAAYGLDIIAGTGNDSLRGGAGADTFRFLVSELDAQDTVQGGDGIDTLRIASAGTVTNAQLTGVTGIEKIVLEVAGTTLNLAGYNKTVEVTGTSGNDTILNVSGSVYAGSGADTLSGSTLYFAADDLTSADTITGGWLVFTQAGALTMADLTGVTGTTSMGLAAGMSLVIDDSFASDNTVVVYSNGTTSETIDASAVTASSVSLSSYGGGDHLLGGSRDDRLAVNNNPGAGWLVNGGAGNDELFISANAPLLLNSSNVRGVEAISLSTYGPLLYGGAVTIVLDDLFINSSTASRVVFTTVLTAATSFNVDASAMTAGHGFEIYLRNGVDSILGGAGEDIVRMDNRSLTAADTVNGGAGFDQLNFDLTYGLSRSITADQLLGVSNFERLAFSDNAALTIVLDEGFMVRNPGVTIIIPTTLPYYGSTVDASALSAAGGGVTATTGASSDRLISGAGLDTFTGGSGYDIFVWNSRDHVLDSITDFSSATDTLRFQAFYFDINGAAFDQAVDAASTAANIDGADLVRYSGGPLDSAADVAAYLTAAAGGSVGEGLFVAGLNTAGQVVLYHVTDASFTTDTDVSAVAVFGSALSLGDLQTSDFLFG